jgi:hypothetical protein
MTTYRSRTRLVVMGALVVVALTFMMKFFHNYSVLLTIIASTKNSLDELSLRHATASITIPPNETAPDDASVSVSLH